MILENRSANFYLFLTALLCIAVTIFVLPRQAKFIYEFDEGKPWLHESLISPFDFAIEKSKEELSQEREQIQERFKPYFDVVSEKTTNAYEKYEVQFHIKFDDRGLDEALVASLYQSGESVLDNIYKKGLLSTNKVLQDKKQDFIISVLDNQVEKDRLLGEIYTLQTAYDYSKSALSEKNIVDSNQLILVEVIEQSLIPNIIYNELFSQKVLEQEIRSISTSRGIVLSNEKIVDRGNVISEQTYQKLISLEHEFDRRQGNRTDDLWLIAGQSVFVTLFYALLLVFLFLFRRNVFTNTRGGILVLITAGCITVMASIPAYFELLDIYMLPFCLFPIVLRTFFDNRIATYVLFISILLSGFVAANSYEFVVYQSIAGLVALFALGSIHKRSQLFLVSLFVFGAYCIVELSFLAIHGKEIDDLSVAAVGSFAISSGLTLLAFPIIYLFEKAFRFTSDLTLMELSDTNSKLLKQLSETAPGTFHHSIQVANLAEKAASEIGANTLLIRAGALYHDIGKMVQPEYFIENQVEGFNPHKQLAPLESADVIINHVAAGIKKARKEGIPESIIHFIKTHHGDTLVRYFYSLAQKQTPDKEPDQSPFRYRGPKPDTKETAILMMADSVEAASRSLSSYNESDISNLVDKIIDHQLNDDQFINAPITFADITKIRVVFKTMLGNIYHVRIAYPDSNEKSKS